MEPLKKVLMIHEMSEDILKLDLSKYILTFDDGLYSQFFYWDLIKKIQTDKIFFIPTGAISKNIFIRDTFSGVHKKFPTCQEAMSKWFYLKNTEDYMTLGELKYMLSEGAVLGGHSHNHIETYDTSCLSNRLVQFRNDTLMMLGWFRDNLNYTPESFCFPFNKEHKMQRVVIGVESGIKNFFGSERIPVESLL